MTAHDWSGARLSGAEVLGRHAGWWRVRCACGVHFVVQSDRLRLADAFARGVRKTAAHVRCERCTSRARGAAAVRNGARFATQRRAKGFRNAEAGVTSEAVLGRRDDRREESDARGSELGAAEPNSDSQMGAVGLSTAGSACPSNPRTIGGDA